MIRLVCGLLALSVLSVANGAADATPLVRQVWQLLDYMAVDYAGAVSGGEITNAAEFAEMREFAATIHQRIQSLPPHPEREALTEQSAALQAAVIRHAPAVEIEDLAHKTDHETATEKRWW